MKDNEITMEEKENKEKKKFTSGRDAREGGGMLDG